MTNKEKYKQAFSAIHISDNFTLEVKSMEKTNKQHKLKTIVALVAACVLVMGTATVAYATDFGGIQRTLQLWIHGDKTEVIVQFDGDGHYKMNYSDSEGSKTQGGGGVAIEDDGTERPLTEEELTQHMTMPEVRYEDDGSAFVYWFDQKIDITDQFENDICYVKLVNGDEVLYMTLKYKNGTTISPHKYAEPSTIN